MSLDSEHLPAADDDPRIAELLRSLDDDAPPSDIAALERIRRAAVGAYRPAMSITSKPVKRDPMYVLTRVAAVCAVLAAGVITWLAGWMSPDGTQRVALGEVIRRTEAASVLHLEFSRGDETSEIWIRQPGEVRWQETPERYEVARGSRLWRVDAASNQVTAEDSPWFTEAGESVALFALLGLQDVDETAFARAQAIRVEEYDGRRCDVYDVSVTGESGPLSLLAYADRKTHELCGLLLSDPRTPDQPPVELRLIARDVPVDEDLFVVAESLTEDGRIGKLVDAQGIVSLKPVMNRRWTPVTRPVLLKPGDWLRTDVRGANAVRASLSSPVQLVVGPASLVEFLSPHEARLHQGEVQITVAAGAAEPFRLLGPGDASVEVTADGRQIVRVARDETLAKVDEAPLWLQGFEGTTNNESLGSLIVNVDGENKPLSVGYHHVSVEIRDQIARTTIEESFVNHTDVRLEGTFHFPLPQDASISGFGMWIGDELVEADIVEKQRAREIYETILREKRDPGLLEWAGGNLFKARVFPIEAHSEKRIKIVYTQVLALRGNQYRYSYALNSELLRTTPLRDLSIDVLISSALPIADVSCSSHSVRSDHTQHAGHVEFTAQEYAPDRDFEVTVALDRQQSDVVVVPHRRGEDGYFLLQLMPPGSEGNFQREVLPDGAPLDLILLCDTSASMDTTKRQEQADFVAALLTSLGAADRFRLAACDVSTVWGVEQPTASTEESRAAVAQFLSDRVSLGWTDLDQAFAAIEEKLGENTQVVYIGDGIVSTGDADPAAFVNRLKRIFPAILDPQSSFLNAPAFHAVAVGNSYESVVLKGIAQLGSGSQRAIGGEQTPQVVALELLNELAQPGLRDINLEFRGLKVAAVYPEVLPNVAAGTQQIIVGRYLPEGKDQQGSVVVTGTLNGEPVRYVAQVALADAEAGNSFIPRLWARAHLDHLLAQGTSEFIQSEIIRLSEEFHIITPYTSLLVLESDADRERFGVQRRYEMRDGEQFFAEGRDNATYELVQQQMRRAGDWRIGLRRRILTELAELGRDPNVFQQWQQWGVTNGPSDYLSASLGRMPGLAGRPISGPASYSGLGVSEYFSTGGVGFGGGGGGEYWDRGRGGDMNGLWDLEVDRKLGKLSTDEYMLGDFIADGAAVDKREQRAEEVFAGEGIELDFLSDYDSPLGEAKSLMGWAAEPMQAAASLSLRSERTRAPYAPGYGYGGFGGAWGGRGYRNRYMQQPSYLGWVDQLFPVLPQAPARPAARPPEAEWPADVRAITDSLWTAPALREIAGGVAIHGTTESRDVRWDRVTSHSESLELYSPKAWLTRPDGIGPERIVNWCDGEQRGVFSSTFGGGRVRKAEETDLSTYMTSAIPFAQQPLHQTYTGTAATITSREGDLAVIKLTYIESNPPNGVRLTIDTARHVVTKVESFTGDKTTATTEYTEFVEVQGVWWPTRWVSSNPEGLSISTTTQQIEALEADAYQQRLNAELAAREQVLFIDLPFVDVDTAKQKVADGSAGFNEHLAVLMHFTLSQQWDKVREQLAAIEQVAAGKPLIPWLQAAVWADAGDHEPIRQLMRTQAEQLVQNQRPDEAAIAEKIRVATYSYTSWQEYGEFVDLLKPVYDRQPAVSDSVLSWQQYWLSVLQNVGRNDAALTLLHTMAEANPWNVGVQVQYAQQLATSGDSDGSYAWFDAVLARETPLTAYERQSVYSAYDQQLRNEGEYDRLVTVLERWIAQDPAGAGSDPYSRLLSALVFADRVDEAAAHVREWTAAARIAGRLPDDVRARLDAAVAYMLGQSYNLYWYHVDMQWLPLLKETVLFHVHQPDSFDVTWSPMNNSNFRDSDECDAVLREVLALVKAEIGESDPYQLQQMIAWLQSGQIKISEDEWRGLAAALRARWEGTTNEAHKYTLGNVLSGIYSAHDRAELYLPFLRLRIDAEAARYRGEHVQSLFNVLIAEPWSDAIEAEIFALLPRLQEPADPRPLEELADDAAGQQALTSQIVAQIGALHQAIDRMIDARVQAAQTELQTTGHPEELTRPELASKQAEFRTAARTAVAARLQDVIAQWTLVEEVRTGGARQELILKNLADWAFLEKLRLDVLLARDLDVVRNECWKILGDAPPQIAEAPAADDPRDPLDSPIQWTQNLLDGLRRHRALVTVMNLAARRSAANGDAARVIAYLDAGIAQGGDDALLWKDAKYRFLVALDRPDELAAALRQWIAADAFTAPWRSALARLVAERGELNEAIQLLEAVEQKDELSPSDYIVLSDWYQVVDRRADYERARVEALKVMEEWQLQQLVQQEIQRWQQPDGARGNNVSDEALFALRAVLEKSSSPGSYVWMLRELYTASRDFRVLRALPESVIGRTPQQVYSVLVSLGEVLSVLDKEATSDEVLAHIAELRPTTESPLDLRALDLLEAMVERRASEVLNQPGPHLADAVAAMQRAFDRKWGDGEPRQMAAWLSSLGNLSQSVLRNEQLRELRALDQLEPSASNDGLWIAYYLSSALFNGGDYDAGIARMENAVRDFAQAHAEGWPDYVNEPLSGYVGFLEQRRSYSRGEQLLQQLARTPTNAGQALWFAGRMDDLYVSALQNDGTVSLGSRETLLANLERHILEECATPDQNQRYNLIVRLLSVYRIGKDKQLRSTVQRTRQFAFDTLPELLSVQTVNYSSIVQSTADTVHDVITTRTALEFLVTQMENYPDRYEFTWENPWNQFNYALARWLEESEASLGALEPRVLALVLTELKRDLLQREQRNRYIYHDDYSYYWEAHTADYLRTAEEVYAERKQSGRSIKYIAEYLWHGLNQGSRAIEILFIAQRDGLLDDGGLQQLISYLFQSGRHAESIPILEPLVAAYPDNMSYRTQLLEAYFRSQRPAQLRELLAATDAHFHKEGRWTEGNMAALAQACVTCELFQEAIAYYDEVIPLHQRTQPDQGIGNGTLSSYYIQLATAHARLGHTPEAVDAASGAIVSWGAREDGRRDALNTLNSVLRDSPDLDAYVKSLDARAEKDKQDSPILRKAVGTIYHERANHAEAARNLQLALELSPGDSEVYSLLLKSYDALERMQDAIDLILSRTSIEPHNLTLYRELATRLADDPSQAERAATSLVEASPLEAENQQALAQLRETQNRWNDAVPLWERASELWSLEPQGLIGLATAQVHAGDPDAAQQTLNRLKQHEWPSRFDNELANKLPELQNQINAARQ